MKSVYGRSMSEMLGVLAIVGVLSIGAVAGIRAAMTRHKVNQLIEDVKLAGFIVSDERLASLGEEEVSLSASIQTQTNYPFSALKETNTTFAVIVEGVAEQECKEAISRQLKWLEEIRVENDTNTCAENNNLLFYFNSKMNADKQKDIYCVTDADCGECGVCEGRRCIYESGPIKSGNKCLPCDGSNIISNVEQNSCNLCENRFWQSIYSKCFSCDEPTAQVWIPKEECLRCSNRYWSNIGNSACYVCPENGVLNEEQTRCDVTCDAGEFFNFQKAECQTCSDETTYFLTQEECAKCPENTRFWQRIYSRCFSCDEPTAQAHIPKEECLRCSNRYFQDNKCILCDGTVSEDGTQCIPK